MKVPGTILQTLAAAALTAFAAVAAAQPINLTIPRSSIAQETALIDVLSRVHVKGNGRNGLPPDVMISYGLSNPGHCALALQPYLTPDGSPVSVPSGKPESLRMHEVANLSAPSDSQLQLIYKDGSSQAIAVPPEQFKNLLAAIQAYGGYCLKLPAPDARYVLRPVIAAKPVVTAVATMPAATNRPTSRRAAHKAFSDILIAFQNKGSGNKFSAGASGNDCITRLTVHVPGIRVSSDEWEEAHDEPLLIDWSRLVRRPTWKADGSSVFFDFPDGMADSDHWPMLLYLAPVQAANFAAATDFLVKACAPGL